jgi:putative Holliday junction resolvase
MRRLGIDLGTVRTGLAVAEPEVRVATPLCTLEHRSLQQAVTAVAKVIADERIAEAIVGLPLHMNGREGDAARRVRAFAKALAAEARIVVRLWDERLSTEASLRSLRDQSLKRGRQKRVVDQIAASLILQGYLDREAGGALNDADAHERIS